MGEPLAQSIDIGMNKSGLVDKFVDDGRDRKLNKIWVQFDVDDSGGITKDELKRGMSILDKGTKYEADGVDGLMDTFDTSSDGIITMNEFLFNMPEKLKEKLL